MLSGQSLIFSLRDTLNNLIHLLPEFIFLLKLLSYIGGITTDNILYQTFNSQIHTLTLSSGAFLANSPQLYPSFHPHHDKSLNLPPIYKPRFFSGLFNTNFSSFHHVSQVSSFPRQSLYIDRSYSNSNTPVFFNSFPKNIFFSSPSSTNNNPPCRSTASLLNKGHNQAGIEIAFIVDISDLALVGFPFWQKHFPAPESGTQKHWIVLPCGYCGIFFNQSPEYEKNITTELSKTLLCNIVPQTNNTR